MLAHSDLAEGRRGVRFYQAAKPSVAPMALIAGMVLSGSENNPHAVAWFVIGAMAALGLTEIG